MTAADNKTLMQAIFAGLAVGDGALFREHLAEDSRLIVMGKTSWSQTIEGAEAMLAYWGYIRSIFGRPSRSVPERFIADGDVVVVEARGDNAARTGERYDNQYCLVFQLRDGMIIEMREYMDTAFAEQVFGLYPRSAAT